MKLHSWATFVLGIALAVFGIWASIQTYSVGSLIPLVIGIGLAFLGWRGGRTGLAIFGHSCVIVGCFLVTWGIYLLPHVKPTIGHVFMMPLFWGLFSIFGGICANMHSSCACLRGQR